MINIRNEMVDEIKRLSDDEILKGDIESMAADFAAKHQTKLPVLEDMLTKSGCLSLPDTKVFYTRVLS
jgi:hypothetical protein